MSMWKSQLIKVMWEQHTIKVNVKKGLSTDKLQAVSKMQNLDMIIREGPMPPMPTELQAAIMNYCHGLPTDLAKDVFSEDYHLFYCYGIDP